DEFSRGAGRQLLAAPYARPETIDRQRALDLAALCTEWLKAQRPQGVRGRAGARTVVNMWTLAWPWVLIALPLPWLVRALLPGDAHDRDAALKVPSTADFVDLAGLRGAALRKEWRLAALAAVWVLAVLAAARPQY